MKAVIRAHFWCRECTWVEESPDHENFTTSIKDRKMFYNPEKLSTYLVHCLDEEKLTLALSGCLHLK